MTLRTLDRKWLLLLDGTPGKRFQNYYRRNHRNGAGDDLAIQILRLAVATVSLCIGILLIFLPLVYIPFLLISAALFAAESRTCARFLDQGEAWMRAGWAQFKSSLKLSPAWVHAITGTLTVACLAAAGWTLYAAFAP